MHEPNIGFRLRLIYIIACCRKSTQKSVKSQTPMNKILNNFDKINRDYSSGPIDDLIRFWRLKVKVTAGRRGGEGIHVDVGNSKSILDI